MIDTKCPYCQIESEADDVQLNRAVRCPGCRKVFILHAHSTEIPLDPIIPGVPRHKPGEEEAHAVTPDAGSLDTAVRHTLKMRSVRKTPMPGARPVSPLLDAEPALHHPPEPAPDPSDAERREVVITGLRIPFGDLFRTTGLVMASILIFSLIGGALVFLVRVVLGTVAGGK
jgi:hypothetical protein